MLVPVAAVLPGETGGTAVLVIDSDQVAHRRAVQLGRAQGDKVQILSGVRAGEEVVMVGGMGVDDKAKVKVIDTNAEEPKRTTEDRAGRRSADQKKDEAKPKEMSDLRFRHRPADATRRHWTARHGKPIIFVILTLVAVGIYLALTIPVAVFPDTNFPRIVVGVDNGVFPIDQMLVTVTRPLEEAVNTGAGAGSPVVASPAAARRKSTCSSTGTSTCTARWNW